MTPAETRPTPLLSTARLRLRDWTDADRAPFAALNADPEVMRYFPATLPRDASDRGIDAFRASFATRGFGNWAVERCDTGELIGFVGLSVPVRPLPFMPCVEIGWRLARAQWHQGFATEAAQAALRFGFEDLGLQEIVSFTTLSNAPSRAVMERLGMQNAQQDFEHPGVPEGHPLRPHCLYRLPRVRWAAAAR